MVDGNVTVDRTAGLFWGADVRFAEANFVILARSNAWEDGGGAEGFRGTEGRK